MIKNSFREENRRNLNLGEHSGLMNHRPNSLGWASHEGGGPDSGSIQGFTQYGRMRPSPDTGFPEIAGSNANKAGSS